MDPLAGERPLHTRTLDVEVVAGEAGAWQVRAELLDLRKGGFVPIAGDLQTAGLLHHMRLRGRLDPGSGSVAALEAEQPVVAFEASRLSCGESCRDPIARIGALVGARVGSDYDARLDAAIGGPRGCSHVLSLARLLGSALAALCHEERHAAGGRPRPGERVFHRTLSFDGREQGEARLELTLQLTDLHFAPAPELARPMQRFRRQVELRGRASLELADLCVRALQVAERTRGPDDLASAGWVDWSPRAAPLVGAAAARGLRRRIRECLSDGGEPLLASLLQLAPAAFQCAASLCEHWPELAAGDPSLVVSGAPADSCYIWRRDGALHRAREREEDGRA